jgi:hypothetical protein
VLTALVIVLVLTHGHASFLMDQMKTSDSEDTETRPGAMLGGNFELERALSF